MEVLQSVFWLIWFINQRALYNHELSVVHRCVSLLALSLALLLVLSVHTSPCHRVRHRNFIFGTHMHICPPYMHIKYLVILTYSFKWQLFWYFPLICYPAHIGGCRDFILHILKYLLFTYVHKRNNATVTYL